MPSAFLMHRYLFLIPLATIEGPLLAVACGVGVALNYLNPFAAYAILIVGDLIPDLLYWSLGRWGVTLPWVRRAAFRIKLIRDHLLPLEKLWHTRLLITLASAKLAWGASAPLVVSAGMSKIPFWRFVGASLLVSIPYLAILMGIGYGMTKAYGYLDFTTQNAAFYIAIIGAIFLILLITMVYYTRKQMNLERALEESNIIGNEN